MKQRILSTIFVLMAFVGITRSQTLSVEPLSLPAGAEGEIVVGLNGVTTMTALQFCINIPDGYELNSQGEGFGAVLGNATRGGHTVNVQQVGERDYLVVVYSMHLNTFANGELVKIPVVASGEACTATGSLYNIRMANKDAESFEYSCVTYTTEVKYPTLAVEPVTVNAGEATTLEVNISNATAMTALQFNLSFPSGVAPDINAISRGNATNGHILNVQPLACGDYLVILYNLYKITFSDGTLLSIPVVAGENSGTITGSLYNVRMSTADAVSYKCEDASFKVTIKSAAVEVTGITLDKATVTITEGETETLTATITPSNATDKTVTWTTNNSAVATVDNGVVTAVKAGTATITATAGGCSASCVVTVEAAVCPITSLAELNNSGVYYIYQANHSKGATSWAVATNGNALKSNKDLNIATDMNDTRQQFAILSIDGGATRYLYHVATKKFVNKDGSLSTTPADAISFMNGAYDNTFFAYFDGSHYVNVGGSQQMIIDGWNTPDGGNSCSIIPVGEFDSAAALKAINDFATGIDEVNDEVKGENGEVKAVYDLQGRKVENPTTGIYIINGKKVLVK